MLIRDLILATGGSATKTFTLCQELAIGPDTAKKLSYPLQRMNDTALSEAETNVFLLAMAKPEGNIQETCAAKFNSLKAFFTSIETATTHTIVVEMPAEEIPEVSADEDIDLFGGGGELAVEQPEVSDDLPWDTDEDDLSFMDTPSVDAEPVSYDRTNLEADDSEPELVVDTSPDVDESDDLGEIFG